MLWSKKRDPNVQALPERRASGPTIAKANVNPVVRRRKRSSLSPVSVSSRGSNLRGGTAPASQLPLSFSGPEVRLVFLVWQKSGRPLLLSRSADVYSKRKLGSLTRRSRQHRDSASTERQRRRGTCWSTPAGARRDAHSA